jgi:peptidoglycan/xylan/chitin deacetylase (PgdA/CDA1 family)
MTGGTGLVLTFDDCFVDGWFSALDMFRHYDVKATFFISWPQRISQRQRRLLHKIQNAGHEIGCHTLTHARLPKFLRTRTLEDYVAMEVDAAIAVMNDMGFAPRSFSYPYFKYSPDLHAPLLERFDILRVEGPLGPLGNRIIPPHGNRLVNTFCFTDQTGMELDFRNYADWFAFLKHTGGYAVTCGHSIGDYVPRFPRMRCSLPDLETIVALAAAHGFEFRTMSDIAAPALQAEEPLRLSA